MNEAYIAMVVGVVIALLIVIAYRVGEMRNDIAAIRRQGNRR